LSRLFEQETLSIRRKLLRWRQRAATNRDLALEWSRQAECDRWFNAVNRAAEADRRSQAAAERERAAQARQAKRERGSKILTNVNVWLTSV